MSLKTVHELIQQIQGLAEEADLTQSRQQVYAINQHWTELSLRLAKLKGSLLVSCAWTESVILSLFILVSE